MSRTWLQSNRCHRDDVADGHSALVEDHPVNNQPKNLLLDLKGWIDERGANACAERLKSFQEPDCLLTFAALPAEFVKPLAQMSGMVLDLPTAFLQLIQLDRGRLVGIDQPRDLAVQGLELALQARAFALISAIDGGVAPALLKMRPQQLGIRQELGDPAPDLILERLRRHASAVAGAGCMAWIAGRAEVAASAPAVRDADHAPATPATDQQRAQQIPMPGVVAPGPLAVAGQLLLGQVPEVGINDGGHRHRDPFLDRSESVAVTVARA